MTLATLQSQHPEWCFTCGRIGQIHGTSNCPFVAPVIAALKEELAKAEAALEQERHRVTCAGKHGHNPTILDCPKCVEEERDQLRAELGELREAASAVLNGEPVVRMSASRAWRWASLRKALRAERGKEKP